jgi:hypothetical protein
MSVKTAPHLELERSDAASGRVFALALGGASALMLLGAGGLLWWRHGDAVFTEIALAGLAWCF